VAEAEAAFFRQRSRAPPTWSRPRLASRRAQGSASPRIELAFGTANTGSTSTGYKVDREGNKKKRNDQGPHPPPTEKREKFRRGQGPRTQHRHDQQNVIEQDPQRQLERSPCADVDAQACKPEGRAPAGFSRCPWAYPATNVSELQAGVLLLSVRRGRPRVALVSVPPPLPRSAKSRAASLRKR